MTGLYRITRQSTCEASVSQLTLRWFVSTGPGLVIQRRNELHNLEVKIEPTLQPITGEVLNGGANRSPDARVNINPRGFWEKQRSAFFDIRACHP